MLGATPHVRNFTDGKATTAATAINPGYVDHVRRMSSLDSLDLVGDQDDGTATAGKNEHVYAFSMDEVVIKPKGSTAVLDIERDSQVDAVFYEAGTKHTIRYFLLRMLLAQY